MRTLQFKKSVSSNVVKHTIDWSVNGVSKAKTEVPASAILNEYYTTTNSSLGEVEGDLVEVVMKAVNSAGNSSSSATARFTVPVILPEPPTNLVLS